MALRKLTAKRLGWRNLRLDSKVGLAEIHFRLYGSYVPTDASYYSEKNAEAQEDDERQGSSVR